MHCKFCQNEIPLGTGIVYVEKEGKQINLCSQKCKHNMIDLGREGRLQKWTKHGEVLKSDKVVEEKKESALAKEIADKLAAKEAEKAAKAGEKKK
jgi:ribosomal protein L24E